MSTVDVAESIFIGLDLRILFGSDIEPFGLDVDADDQQLAILLGAARGRVTRGEAPAALGLRRGFRLRHGGADGGGGQR